MYKYLIVYLFVLLSNNIHAQQISRLYNTMKGNEIAVYYDIYNKFLLTAGVYDPGLPGVVNGELLSVLDFEYNVKKKKIFIQTFLYSENDPIAISNDTIILLGTGFLQSPNHWIIYLTNRDLDSIAYYTIDHFTIHKNVAVGIIAKNSKIYLGGRTLSLVSNSDEVIMIKMDMKGNILKEERFHDIFSLERINGLTGFIETSDDNFAIIGLTVLSSEDEDLPPEYMGSASQPRIIKFDDDLNEIWSKYLPPAGLYYTWPKITATHDGGLIGNWTIDITDPEYPKSHYHNTVWPVIMYKLDIDGELVWTDTLWTKRLPTGAPGTIRRIARLYTAQNGDVIGIGSYQSPAHDDRQWASMFRYSSDGELLWEKIYEDINFESKHDYFLNITEADNGDLVLTGYFWDINGEWNNATYSWLLRVDSLGCFESGCGVSDSVQLISVNSELITGIDKISPPEREKRHLAISPNPAISHISISLPEAKKGIEWQIYDMKGNKILIGNDSNHTNTYEIEVSSLGTGMYFIQVRDGDGDVYQLEKIMITR